MKHSCNIVCLTGSVGNEYGVKIKNHTSKILCSDSCYYRLVRNAEVCCIYSCWLKPLTSMHECKFYSIALALFSYVASILRIDRYSCLPKPSNEAMSNKVRATEHLCVRVILGTAATYQTLSYAQFDVHVALVQYAS